MANRGSFTLLTAIKPSRSASDRKKDAHLQAERDELRNLTRAVLKSGEITGAMTLPLAE
jgi:hypothetical protein